MSDDVPQGYNNPPNGEPLRPEEWSAGYEAGIADQAEKIRVLREALDATLDFAGTVAGGASWWDDVWAEHQQKIEALEKTK